MIKCLSMKPKPIKSANILVFVATGPEVGLERVAVPVTTPPPDENGSLDPVVAAAAVLGRVIPSGLYA